MIFLPALLLWSIITITLCFSLFWAWVLQKLTGEVSTIDEVDMSDSDEDMKDDINASTAAATATTVAAAIVADTHTHASTGLSGKAASSAADGEGRGGSAGADGRRIEAVETVGFGGSLVARKELENGQR